MEKHTDKIVLNRKWVWLGGGVILVLFLIVIFLVFNSNRGVKLSTSGVEISPPVNTRKDTVITPAQPAVKERNVYGPAANKQPVVKSTSVKNGDTTVVVEGQPANINFGNNNVVGNNNSNISINPKPKLNEHEKIELITSINENLKKIGKDKSTCINLIVPVNVTNPDANYLAIEIEKFLKGNGYNIQRDFMTIVKPVSINGIFIDFKKEATCGEITVWMN